MNTARQSPASRRPVGVPLRSVVGLGLALIGILIILYFDDRLRGYSDLPDGSEHLSYGLLFVAGLLTGFHCVGMCGALVISYAAKSAVAGKPSLLAHLSYGVGKTLSYSVIGALFGTVGSIIAFTPFIRGVVGASAGVFLILFGLGLLNVWPALHDLHIRPPAFLLRFIGRESRKTGNPFVIGLLNGLMILCGPLQAMYIMAAGTGSTIEGAKLLFIFGLGTLPVMLGFGVLASMISARMTPALLHASGAIVVILGAIMLNRGLAMTGSGYDFHSLKVWTEAKWESRWNGTAPGEGSQIEGMSNGPPSGSESPAFQEVHMRVTAKGFEPNRFTVRKGIPVRWIIDATELNPCTSGIVVPTLGLEFQIKLGEQTIEFTPQQDGVIPWSCWMGMMPGAFVVVGATNR